MNMSLIFSLILHGFLLSLMFIKINPIKKNNIMTEEVIKVSIAHISSIDNIKSQIKKQKLNKEFDENSSKSNRKDINVKPEEKPKEQKQFEKLDLPKPDFEPIIEDKKEPNLDSIESMPEDQNIKQNLEQKPEPKPELSKPKPEIEQKSEPKLESPKLEQKQEKAKSEQKSIKQTTLDKKTKKQDLEIKKNKNNVKLNENKKATSKQKANKKQSSPDIIDDLLKNFEEKSSGKNEKSNKKSIKQGTSESDIFSEQEFDASKQLSISEINFIKQKVSQNWNLTSVNQSIKQFKTVLHIKINKDGTLQTVKVLSKNCPVNLDCEALIQATERAVQAASPFNELDIERYDIWSEIELDFTPEF